MTLVAEYRLARRGVAFGRYAAVAAGVVALISGCASSAPASPVPVPDSAWTPEMDARPPGLEVHEADLYMPADWMPLDSLMIAAANVGLQAHSWTVLAVPISVGENVLVPATGGSAELVFTPVEVRVVRVLRDAGGADNAEVRPGGQLTVAIPGGAADGHYYESSLSTYDKGLVVQGGVFALELVDNQDYPGMGEELLLSRGFRLNASDLSPLQLGVGGRGGVPTRVAASVFADAGLDVPQDQLGALAAGTHPDVLAALADDE